MTAHLYFDISNISLILTSFHKIFQYRKENFQITPIFNLFHLAWILVILSCNAKQSYL